jgi:hypothetical protein
VISGAGIPSGVAGPFCVMRELDMLHLMRRRELLYSLLGAAAVPSFVQAQSARGADDLPAFELTSPDAVAKSAPRFFGAPQFASFARLGNVLMPAAENEPGALDARAPEFLDFLLSESPAELQVLYRNGVQELDARSLRALKRPFVKLTAAEAAPILAPLSEPWTYQGAGREGRILAGDEKLPGVG